MSTTTKPRLLCVDDEPSLLDGIGLALRGRYDISFAHSGAEALALFDGHDRPPFDAVVSDMRMPEMSGAALLTILKERHPEMPLLLLSGQADVESAIAAINDAKVFRFLTKPCPPELLMESIDEAVQQARVQTIERDLLDRTLNGTVDMLTDVLGLVSHEASERSRRIRNHVYRICSHLKRPAMWELDLAAMLCQLGFVVMPDVGTGHGASAELRERRVELAAELLIQIPRLQAVAALIRGQLAPEPVRLDEDIEAWSERELNAEILRLAVHFEESMACGMSSDEAFDELMTAEVPTPTFLLEAVAELRTVDAEHVEGEVGVEELQARMVLIDDLALSSGPTLVPAGMELTASLINRVRSFAQTIGVEEPIRVKMPAPPSPPAPFS